MCKCWLELFVFLIFCGAAVEQDQLDHANAFWSDFGFHHIQIKSLTEFGFCFAFFVIISSNVLYDVFFKIDARHHGLDYAEKHFLGFILHYFAHKVGLCFKTHNR